VAVRHGDTQFAFALLLRYYGRHGRFPRNRGELHPDAVEFMARAVKADPADLAGYDWPGRTIKRHRTEIRQARPCTPGTRSTLRHRPCLAGRRQSSL